MRSYFIAAAVVAIAGGIGGSLYGAHYGIEGVALWAMLAAFVVEAVLYLGCGFEAVRDAWPKPLLALSAVVPYLIYTVPLGLAQGSSVVLLLVLAALVVWWLDVVPEHYGGDLLLIAMLAAVYLARVFPALYPDVHPRIPMATLGHLMWVRLALITLLKRKPDGRKVEGIEFGFVPTLHECAIGGLHFLAFLPVGAALLAAMHYGAFAGGPGTFGLARGWWYKAAIGFVGGWLLVAASEEILFRGVLQRRLMGWWGQWPGLVAASIAFGLVHLPYRGFPNWPHVALTMVLGLFLGHAYIKGHGVRAPMLAHALTIAAGRAFGM